MSKVVFKAKPMQFKNGCLLLPATPADRIILNSFAESCGSRYCTVTATFSKSNKTYDQVKTVWALCGIITECKLKSATNHYGGVKPTDEQVEVVYMEMLEMFAEREPNIYNPETSSPIHLSKMSKIQASQFINSLINLIYEYLALELDDRQIVDLTEIFTKFKENEGFGELNHIDYAPDGHLYTIDEWCENNNVSMASGVGGEDLQIAHIISKGAHPEYRDCTWNWLRLTHYEHIEIQHKKGWKEFLSMFPHLIPRVKTAYDKVGELYPFTMIEEFEEFEKEHKREEKVKVH